MTTAKKSLPQKVVAGKGAKSAPTGPRSAQGKAVSSQNALTHGATSKRWLTAEESESFEGMLKDLRAHYPSPNPLVKMQIERIARLRVQLERIQGVIDAAFVAARSRTIVGKQVALDLDLSDGERAVLARRMLGRDMRGSLGEFFNEKIIDVAIELDDVDRIEMLTTHQDFADRLPIFCGHIIDQAQERRETLEEYLSSRQVEPPEAQGKPKFSHNIRVIIKGLDCAAQEMPYERPELTSVSVQTLQRSASWFGLQLWHYRMTIEKLKKVVPLISSAEDEITPDLDKLDSLMRYQTTINRQLSTAMGELLALTKA